MNSIGLLVVHWDYDGAWKKCASCQRKSKRDLGNWNRYGQNDDEAREELSRSFHRTLPQLGFVNKRFLVSGLLPNLTFGRSLDELSITKAKVADKASPNALSRRVFLSAGRVSSSATKAFPLFWKAGSSYTLSYDQMGAPHTSERRDSVGYARRQFEALCLGWRDWNIP